MTNTMSEIEELHDKVNVYLGSALIAELNTDQ